MSTEPALPVREPPNVTATDDAAFIGDAADATVGRDAGWTALGQIANAASGLVLVVAAARVLDVDDFAALNWALSTIIYLAAVARVGGMQAGTFLTVATPPPARRPAIATLATSGVVAAIATAAVWVLLSLSVESWTEQRALTQRLGLVVALSVPAATLLPVLVAVLRGLGNFRLAALFSEHFARLAVIAVFAVVALGGSPTSSTVALALVAALVAQVVGSAVSFRSIRAATPPATSPTALRDVLRAARPFYLIGLAAIVMPVGGVWLLALVGSAEEVARFGLAARLSFAFTLPFAVGGRVFFPRMVGQLHTRPPILLERLRHFATLATLSGVVMTGLLLTARRPFVAVFGTDLAGAYTPLLILAIGALANTATGLCMGALSAAGRSSLVARASGIAVIASGAAIVVLGSRWGATGAAAATTLTMVLLNGSMWLTARRVLGIDTSARFGRTAVIDAVRTFGGLR